jgi:hypothetical protein
MPSSAAWKVPAQEFQAADFVENHHEASFQEEQAALSVLLAGMKDQILINTPLQRGGFGQSNSFEPFLTVFSLCTRAGFAVIKSERNSQFTRGRSQ